MNELPIIATVTSLVSAAISSAKNAREIAKDSSDHELKNALNDLHDVLSDVRDRAFELDEENRILKAQLLLKTKYVGPIKPFGYFFSVEDSEQPLCPKCFQAAPQQIGFMSGREPWSQGVRRKCHLCQFVILEEATRSGRHPTRDRNYWE